MNHTFLSLKNPRTDTFLCDLGLATLHSTAQVWNPQEISKLMIKVDCHLSYDNFLALCSRQCAGLPCYKCFAAGSSTYPCHMACISKSVIKDIISLSDYVPNSTEVPQMRRAIVGADHSASLTCDCQGQMNKVVFCWYCFCCIRQSFSGTPFAYGFLLEKGMQEPILQTRQVACKTCYQ